jgi:hypothetical protein
MVVGLAAAAVAFLGAGIVVTQMLADRVWPSLFVGLPAGTVAGVLTFLVVVRALRARPGR